MRLLIVTDRVGNLESNGSEVFCSLVIADLRARHQVTVVGRAQSTHTPDEITPEGDLAVSNATANDSKLLLEFLRKNLKLDTYDLVYNLGALVFASKTINLIRIMAPALPVVNHFQANLIEYATQERQSVELLNAARDQQVSCVRGSALNIFASLAEYRIAIKHRFPLERIPAAIIPNAVRLTDFQNITPDDSYLPENHRNAEQPPIILFTAGGFGDFCKGGDMVYRAFTNLISRGHNIFLCAVTNSDRFTYLLKDIPTDRFTILPWLPRAEFLAKMAASDAVIVPSRYESFGLVAAEAMLLGKPVVANAVGGLEEVVRHQITGLLNEPAGGSFGLTVATERLIEDPTLRNTLGARAATIASDEYNINRITQMIDRELHRALQYSNALVSIHDSGIALVTA